MFNIIGYSWLRRIAVRIAFAFDHWMLLFLLYNLHRGGITVCSLTSLTSAHRNSTSSTDIDQLSITDNTSCSRSLFLLQLVQCDLNSDILPSTPPSEWDEHSTPRAETIPAFLVSSRPITLETLTAKLLPNRHPGLPDSPGFHSPLNQGGHPIPGPALESHSTCHPTSPEQCSNTPSLTRYAALRCQWSFFSPRPHGEYNLLDLHWIPASGGLTVSPLAMLIR